MLEDAAGIRRVVLACGVVDLRKGIDGLAMIIGDKYKQNPFEVTRTSGQMIQGLGEAHNSDVLLEPPVQIPLFTQI